MATITKNNTFASGATIASAEVNANFDTIYNEFNGSIDNDNIKAGAAIALTKLAGTAWTSYTPTATWAGGQTFTLGNGTLSGSYQQIGKTVICKIYHKPGSTSNYNSGVGMRFSLPVNAKLDPATTNVNGGVCGSGWAYDAGSAWYILEPAIQTGGTTVQLYATSSSTYTAITNVTYAVPFTWAANDEVGITLVYEAA